MATHVKANTNKKKHKDTIVKITENIYYDDLIKESNEDELIDTVEDEDGNAIIELKYDAETGKITENNSEYKFKHIKESTIDPDAGYYHKGEHEKQFAYSASALCDKNGFILETYITSGNIHDSISFDGLYNNYKKNFYLKRQN